MAKGKARKEKMSDKEKWNKVFNALVQMIQTQQTQLGSLAKERKLLEDRIKLQYDRWVSDVNLFKDQISQMEIHFTAQEMERVVEASKSELLMGLKQREVSMYKHKLENVDGELADFTEWFDILSLKQSAHEKITHSRRGEPRLKKIESEVKRLKNENEKLTSEKNSEVSALLAEKNFVWNQYNNMESKLKEHLQRKSAEVDAANQKIQMLLTNIEELQSSNTQKDNEVVRLKRDLDKLESDSIKKNEEISKLSRELQSLKEPRSVSATPLVRRCTTGRGKNSEKNGKVVTEKKESGSQQTPVLRRCTTGRGKNSAMDGKVVTVKKESDSQQYEKGSRSSKRKAIEVITISDTPKLFTSSFKVPKLKSAASASSCVTFLT